MRFPATMKIVAALNERSRLIRANNMRINQWVAEYIDRSITNGEPVTVLSQWCLTRNLELRRERQGGRLLPTRKERRLFEEEIPRVASLFLSNGVRLNWWLTFNRAFADSWRLTDAMNEQEYKAMILALAEPFLTQGWLVAADWEDDILGKRSEPNAEVLRSIERFVEPKALERETRWVPVFLKEETNLKQTEAEVYRDVVFNIACEAEEGKLLGGTESPFGEFILIPLDVPEQYDFFTIFCEDFKKRIVPVLSTHPWRLKESA